jgi:D-arabinono-1,4-lactone oxidase.
LEAALIPLGAKPHWGKLIHADAATLAPLYPRISDFRACALRHDPGASSETPIWKSTCLVEHWLRTT